MTYSDLYKSCVDELNSAGFDEASTDVSLLFEYLINKDRNFIFAHGDNEALSEDIEIINAAVDRRKKHIPVQHITGCADFMGLTFKVSDKVLIPRFDTECLVEEIMTECCDGAKVLDVCTGSGCIIISLSHYKNDLECFATDISKDALLIAEENARELGEEVVFFQGDLFENVTEKGFDYIISNPPYIRSNVISDLMSEVKDHDPMLALDGGEDGLIFYRRIALEAKDFLKIGGRLFFEIGNDQGEDVSNILRNEGYKNIEVVKDYAGNDRVVKANI